MLAEKLMGSGAAKTYIEDVFLVNLRTGTGAAASVTGAPNLATYGGMVQTKSRSDAQPFAVTNSARGVGNYLLTNQTTQQQAWGADAPTFTSSGFSVPANSVVPYTNYLTNSYVDYIWRNAPKFFKETTVTKTAGSNATVDLSTLGTVGMVKVKRTDSTGSWYVWHRSLTAGKLLIGETTAAETTLGHITVSGTMLTLVNGVIADGTYHIEAYAHDTSADGLIQCGSYTGNGSASGPTISLGWEPQFLLVKRTDSTTGWIMVDTMRDWSQNANDLALFPHLASAESANATGYPTATGFTIDTTGTAVNASGGTYIYLAIRRGPMRQPTSGTQVYNAIARTGTSAAVTVTGVGFPVDLSIITDRGKGTAAATDWKDRMRGGDKHLGSQYSYTEQVEAGEVIGFDKMDGVGFTAASSRNNTAPVAYINHFFRRYPGVFDQVCVTSAASANQRIKHNLGAVPELAIVKGRNASGAWLVYSAPLGTGKYLALNTTAAEATLSNAFPSPSTTEFGFNSSAFLVSPGTDTIVVYLFATLAGISKVGSYIGNGTSQTIDCGFAAGARFVLLKCADQTSDWRVFDTTRGIIAANDPYLALNTAAAEVTTQDVVDPAPSGFALNALFNDNGVKFIYLALA